jgi:carboxyl-terminal processing protease
MSKNGGGAAFYTEDLGAKRYRGRVIVLLNRSTGSASEGFAWAMKSQAKATLIGAESAGALLGSERFDLLRGWVLTLPTHAAWGPDGHQYIDKAVSPSIAVHWARDDYCAERDPDISKALEILTQANKPQ